MHCVFPGDKTAGVWSWPTTPTSAKVKERVELYLYSPSGPSWPDLRRILHIFWFLYFSPLIRSGHILSYCCTTTSPQSLLSQLRYFIVSWDDLSYSLLISVCVLCYQPLRQNCFQFDDHLETVGCQALPCATETVHACSATTFPDMISQCTSVVKKLKRRVNMFSGGLLLTCFILWHSVVW
jgi:hypothetical protein